MKILGLNIGGNWISSSTSVLVVDDVRKKQVQRALISVLSQMVSVTNQEIKGRCKTGYQIFRVWHTPDVARFF